MKFQIILLLAAVASAAPLASGIDLYVSPWLSRPNF